MITKSEGYKVQDGRIFSDLSVAQEEYLYQMALDALAKESKNPNSTEYARLHSTPIVLKYFIAHKEEVIEVLSLKD